MKKIKKYRIDNDKEDFKERLKSYKIQMDGALANFNSKNLLPRVSSPLASIIPLAAASITPFAMAAQCGVAVFDPASGSQTAVNGGGPGGTVLLVDIDGDGTDDFELDPNWHYNTNPGPGTLADLFLRPLNGAEVIAYAAGGGYYYATRFDVGDNITSTDADWRSAGDMNNNMATLDYQTNAPWHGSGTQTGYVGIRLGDRLGFMEVTWDNFETVSVSSSLSGVRHPDDPVQTNVDVGDCVALPIDLVSFDVKIEKGVSLIKWSTATEISNEGFEIQRSVDGKSYRKLAWINGQGNSNELLDYNFEDSSIQPNTHYYYRLKQIDYDGRSSLSDVVSVISTDGQGIILHDIAPNPVSSDELSLNVSSGIEEQLTLNIFDALGRLVQEQIVNVTEGTNTINLNVEALSNGSYFLKLNGKNNSSYKKMVVAK